MVAAPSCRRLSAYQRPPCPAEHAREGSRHAPRRAPRTFRFAKGVANTISLGDKPAKHAAPMLTLQKCLALSRGEVVRH